MRSRLLAVALALLVIGAVAACSNESSSIFEGDWASGTAGRLSFHGSNWSDSEGDSGRFNFSGKYPIFTVTFVSGAGTFDRRATFADTRTFQLCQIRPSGALFNCDDFVIDHPTLH